jgi:two-component system sensor histidine kinase BaeS
MVERLGAGYARERSWAWIAKDRDRWIDMSRDVLGLPAAPQQADAAGGPRAAQTRDTPLTIDPRLMLFDAKRVQLIGRPDAARLAILKPILVNGETAGFLGYVPRPDIIESIERVYLKRQRIAFASIAAGMLVAALLLAGGLAYWLTRRIRLLARGTTALILGDYHARIETKGNDELAQLARHVNTLAATLAATQQARRQWIADIAHELRTPLSILRAEIESLEDGVRPLDRAAVDSLGHETARLSRLVEDLHTLALTDVGGLTYHKEPSDVAEVLSDVVEAHQRALEQKQLRVHMDLSAAEMVSADESRLSQVFGNLLQNNLRYTDRPGEVHIKLWCEKGNVRIDWEDSGPGVPAEELSRLTDRLYRVESSRSRAGGGSGLGLAIAKAIVEGHAGHLRARASRFGGLAVEITLPALKLSTSNG